MMEAHWSKFAIHPGSTKMYQDMKRQYWWKGMKRNVASFVAKFMIFQQLKVEHQRPSGLFWSLEIQEWKWDKIAMDFVTGLPMTFHKHNAIWVVVDQLTKSAHFILIRIDFSLAKLSKLYIKKVVKLHCFIWGPTLTSRYWISLQKTLGTRLDINTTHHPIQTLEDMLRYCILDFGGNRDEHLPLVEFTYNNSYQASLEMALYEALYRKLCRLPLCWPELDKPVVMRP